EISLRNPPRSSSGTSTGPATASGAMVSPRYSATCVRAAPGFSAKKTESASANATSASPAALAIWTSEYASNGWSESHSRTSGAVAHRQPCRSRCPIRWWWSGCVGARPESIRLRAGEALPEELLDELRVRGAAGLLHHVPDQGVQGALLAASELLHRSRVPRDGLVDDRLERRRVADLLQASLVDDVLDGLSRLERLRHGLLRAGGGDRAVAGEPDEIGDVLRRDAAVRELDMVLVQQPGQILGDPV